MKKRCFSVGLSAVVILTSALWAAPSQSAPGGAASATALETRANEAERAGQLREAFDLYLGALKALSPPPPDFDGRIRERLVVIAPKLTPPPTVPSQAEIHAAGGRIELEEAKTDAGYERAEAELLSAVRLAPWVPELAHNLALVQERLNDLEPAVANFQVYLASSPSDAEPLRARLADLQYRVLRARREHVAIRWKVTQDGAAVRDELWLDSRERVRIGDHERTLGKDLTGPPPLSLPPGWLTKTLEKRSKKMRELYGGFAFQVRPVLKTSGSMRTIAGRECQTRTFAVGRTLTMDVCQASTLNPRFSSLLLETLGRRLGLMLSDYEARPTWQLFSIYTFMAKGSEFGFPLSVSVTSSPRLDNESPANVTWEVVELKTGPIRTTAFEVGYR